TRLEKGNQTIADFFHCKWDCDPFLRTENSRLRQLCQSSKARRRAPAGPGPRPGWPNTGSANDPSPPLDNRWRLCECLACPYIPRGGTRQTVYAHFNGTFFGVGTSKLCSA